MKKRLSLTTLALALSACSIAPVAPPSDGHMRTEKIGAASTASIPAPVQQVAALPKPKAAPKVETYSVVVNNVRVQELLFALARDAKLNVDIHPGIEGLVTLNAIDQTLQQLLARIAKQVDIRWELDGPNLAVMPDSAFLRTYKVDYVNMSRDSTSTVKVDSQITTPSVGGSGGAGSGSGGNTASTTIQNKAENKFWETLQKNIEQILREEDQARWEIKCEQQGSVQSSLNASSSGDRSSSTAVPAAGQAVTARGPGNESAAGQRSDAGSEQKQCGKIEPKAVVIANPGSGIINVRATARQHEKVREFLDQVMASAQRQVLIEATVAEVELSDNYQQGVDWKKVSSGLIAAGTIAGNSIAQATTGLLTIQTTNSGGTFQATVKLLEDYGNVKILSSPKISVLNNQSALLRVVTNEVYFTVKSDVAAGVSGSAPVKAVTTTPHTVAVGFVMAVTPQISDNSTISLNIRPSITSIVDYKKDPNPELTAVESLIPVVRTREMESILRVDSGNIAVMGGLMQDSLNNKDQGLPTLSNMPLFGPLFQQRNDTRKKTELVIFLRPVIIKDASLQGDYAEFRNQLPGQDFFEKGNLGPPQQRLNTPWSAPQ